MQPNEQYIHELITGKLAGVISREEELYLEKLMAENPDVKAQCEQAARMYDQEIKSRQKDWTDISTLLKRRRRKRIYTLTRNSGLLAASITGIVLVVYFFAYQQEPPTTAQKASKTIELKLANGTVIPLTPNRDSIQAGNALLTNTNNTLSYTAGAGEAASLNTLIVPPGMTYQVMLADGSEVWLNSATTLQFPFKFADTAREITIKGEAYLKVAKNPKKPFVVHLRGFSSPPTGGGQEGAVQVLGTEFNVNTYDSGTLKVALVEGAVHFRAAGNTVAIKPGTEAVYAANKGITSHPFDEEEVLGWRQGRYYFYEATLQEIAAGLPRWAGIEVVIDNAAIRERRFTGVLNRDKPITAILDNLKQTLKVDYYFSSDGVLHFK